MAVRGLSFKVKLPLLIGALLVVVTGIYSWAAYARIRSSASAAIRERLATVASQYAQALKTQRDQLVAAVQGVAESPAVRAYAAHPIPAARSAAEAALRPVGLQALQAVTVELWNTEPRRMLAVGDTARWGGAPTPTQLLQTLATADSGAVGRFRAVGDTILYAVGAPVVTGGRTRGYVVQWRLVTLSAQARDQVSRLIGSQGHLLVGNASNDVWTDLSRRVEAPPVDVARGDSVLQYERAGDGVILATGRATPRTPWLVLVEFPRDAAEAPARVFLRQLTLKGVIILVIGLLAAWATSLTLTEPLARLTRAAELVAAGDYTQPVPVRERRDELGRLAAAFDVMVARVRESQQRLEERVRERTAQLQERNEELEAFAYSISHDLRSPLRAMEGFSQALLEDSGDRLDPAGRAHVERVAAAARTMDRLIDDLLAYSRLTRADLELAPLDLGGLVRASLQQLQADVERRRARITVDEPLPAVVAHGPTLAQVVANLIANGIKFVPPERTPEVRVKAERRDGRVRLWVEDNGIGIAPEHHERIFRVFERLHRVTDYPGTGIGLAIVRKAMERMGGTSGVESSVGGGSRFWVELPAVS
ncbi:MAG TPA: ATP-binding protein [Gemmatimonadales bacterium]|nr:ATP-binding protein [Gemmatimonadales bacterium]